MNSKLKVASFALALTLSVVGISQASALSAVSAKPTASPTPKAPAKPSTDKVTGKPTGTTSSTSTTTTPTTGKPTDTGKPTTDTGKPTTDTGKPTTNTGKPTTDTGKPTTNGKPTSTGKPSALDNGPKTAYVVKFVDGTIVGNEISALRSNGAAIGKSFSHVFRGLAVEMTDKQKAALAKRPSVASIALDSAVATTETQVVPAWGIDRIDQNTLPLTGTYSYTGDASATKVFVVDTGVRSTHSDLVGRVAAGFTAISDINGTSDCNGHGTHVAGTIGGTSYGVAKGVTIVPVRVLDCAGSGTISGVVAGLDWIAQNYVPGTSAVVNMSLGGSANSTLDSAVASLINRGITVVVAAGNSAADACTSSPSRVAGAITVAASTSIDGFATYSNFGSCIDIVAPGSAIKSAWMTDDNATATISGTSMATPHVAGVAALLMAGAYQLPNAVALSLATSASANQISGVPTGTNNLLLFSNPLGAVNPDIKAPEAPTNVSAAAARRSATVNWVAAADGGSPLTSNTVRVWSGTTLVKTLTFAGSVTSARVSGLRAGVAYRFSVVATNIAGSSPQSVLSDAVKPTNK